MQDRYENYVLADQLANLVKKLSARSGLRENLAEWFCEDGGQRLSERLSLWLLYGNRHYLVADSEHPEPGTFRLFSLSDIEKITPRNSSLPAGRIFP